MSDLASLVLSSKGVYDEVISRQQNEIHALKKEVKRLIPLIPKEKPKFYFETDEEWETAKDHLFDRIKTIIDERFDPRHFDFNMGIGWSVWMTRHDLGGFYRGRG